MRARSDHPTQTPDGPTAVGAYIFAGGFTLGVKQAGFNVLAQLEGDDAYGVSTSRANFPDLPIYHGPAEWPEDFPEIDLLYGNPPCAAWSGNNPRSHRPGSWKDDPRVECTRQHFDLLKRHRPKIWLWESVPNASTKGRELVDELCEEAHALGYGTIEVMHDAQWLEVPQVRRRWMLVAHRIELGFPTPNWAPPITAAEALEGIAPRGEPAYDSPTHFAWVTPEVIAQIKPGERLRRYWERITPEEERVYKPNGHVKGRPGFGHVRLRPDQPASATVGYSMMHPIEPRYLRMNEIAVLAGFPENYVFLGRVDGVGGCPDELDLVARGVCPPVGRWFARAALSALEDEREVIRPEHRVLFVDKPPEGDEARPAATEPKARTRRTAPTPPPRLPQHRPPRPKNGVRRGEFLKFLIGMDLYTTRQLIQIVRTRYPQARTTPGVISDHRGYLRRDGYEVPPVIRKPRVQLDLT